MKALILMTIMLATTPLKTYDVSLVYCYDGDTCNLNFHLGFGAVLVDQGVRLCDIDTPEMRYAEQKPAAIAARDALVSWMKAAKKLEIQVPQKSNCLAGAGELCDKTGKYGRWLVYIIADGVNLNQKLVKEGFAAEYGLKCQ